MSISSPTPILLLCAMREEYDLFVKLKNESDLITHLPEDPNFPGKITVGPNALGNLSRKNDLLANKTSEALSPVSWRLATTGIGTKRAARLTNKLINQFHPRLIISTGCCGGLIMGLEPGALIIPHSILSLTENSLQQAPSPHKDTVDDLAFIADVLGLAAYHQPLLTINRPLVNAADKHAAHQKYHAIAVDMETACIAQTASTNGIPFVSIRVVLDTVDEDLPNLSDSSKKASALTDSDVTSSGISNRKTTLKELSLRLKKVSTGLVQCLQCFLTNNHKM